MKSHRSHRKVTRIIQGTTKSYRPNIKNLENVKIKKMGHLKNLRWSEIPAKTLTFEKNGTFEKIGCSRKLRPNVKNPGKKTIIFKKKTFDNNWR